MRISRFSNAFFLAFRISAVLMIISSLLLAGSISVHPALATGSNTWTVNVLTDSGLTTCAANTGSSGPACQLRDALSKAASGDMITFTVSGTITLTATLTIGTNVTIQGSGALNLAIDGNHAVQVFTVNSGLTASISGLTIQNGAASTNGGGILNNGTLTVDSSTISNNSAQDQGGGVYNSGSMIISSSTLSNNHSEGNTPITPAYWYGGGGGIYNASVITISNSTISGNSTASTGGGIFNRIYGQMTLSNTTISNNSAAVGVGGVYNDLWSHLNLLSVVSGNNINGDFYWNYSGGGTPNPITSLGHNLIGIQTGIAGLTNGYKGDQIGSQGAPVDAKLANLALNGGSTETAALLNGSPAIGNGDCTGASATQYAPAAPAVITDQRSVSRGSPCDAGAYEGSLMPTATSTATATSSSTFTPTNTATPTASGTPTNTSTATATISGGGLTATALWLTLTAYRSITPTVTSTSTATNTPIPPRIDSIGVYRAGTFYLRLHNNTGNADLTIGFTAGTKPYPIVGDWTGSGFDTVGVFNQSNGQFSLRNSNTPGTPDEQFVLGNPNDQPLSGRWLISATNAGVGVFRPSNGMIYLKNGLTTGFADYSMVLGIPGDKGLAGDWNGKGFDSPGVYRPGNSYFYLSNQVKNGSVFGDYQFQYGIGGDAPVTGDWIAQGHDGVGLFRQSNGFTYLKNALTTGYADNTFTYGIAGDVPVAGHWQVVYPPIAPESVLIAKTAAPSQPSGSVPDNNPLGD